MEESIFFIQVNTFYGISTEIKKLKEKVQKIHPDWIITTITAWEISDCPGNTTRIIVNFEKRG